MEQTSGTSYPNALILTYLKKTGKKSPELLAKALRFLNVGYQRILTFQTRDGGFSWWGPDDSPRLWVTAYGLHQLRDVANVYDVDPNVIEKAQRWLVSRQGSDGAWAVVGDTHGEAISMFQDPRVPLTAYVAWALGSTGYMGEPLRRAIDFLRGHVADVSDSYSLGLAANALLAAGEDATKILDRLDGMKQEEGGTVCWPIGGQTLSFARGGAGSVEATALIALALIRSGRHPATAQKAIDHIIRARAGAAWGSTQATILALKALLASMDTVKQKKPVRVWVTFNGEKRSLTVAPDQADVMQVLDLGAETRLGSNDLEIVSEGEGNLIYQVLVRTYLPWDKVEVKEESPEISFDVKYDRTKLSTRDRLGVDVTLRYHGKRETYMVIVDLGIPAGFEVVREAFERMRSKRKIEKFSITGRQIILYFGAMAPEQETRFRYELRPKHPIRVTTPTSQAYEYYTPDVRSKTRPVRLVVEE